MASIRAEPCPGPLIWYDLEEVGAILECSRCGYLVVSGNVNDAPHSQTPLLREGLA